MKKIILFLEAALFLSVSCTPTVINPNLNYNPGARNSTSIPGNFVLVKFVTSVSNEDSTIAFKGYIFSFGSDGKVNAVKNNQTASGNYIETRTLNDKQQLALYFYNKPLSYLNGSWLVKSISNTSIELLDTSTNGVLEFTAQ